MCIFRDTFTKRVYSHFLGHSQNLRPGRPRFFGDQDFLTLVLGPVFLPLIRGGGPRFFGDHGFSPGMGGQFFTTR